MKAFSKFLNQTATLVFAFLIAFSTSLIAQNSSSSENKSTTQNEEKVKPTELEQGILCQEFINGSLSGLKSTANEFGYELHDIYHDVQCDDITKADLLRHRASLPTARSDLMSFARYYIREHNDAEGLTKIFNRVIDNPGKPRGTLIDWIDYYSTNPTLTEAQKIDFAAYETTIRRFGGKREAEL